MQKKYINWIKFGGSIIGLGFFAYFIFKQNVALLMQHILVLNFETWALSLGLMTLGMFCNTLRWHLLLESQNVHLSFIKTLKIVFGGAFASNFLPSTIGGDTVRIYAIYASTKRKSLAIGSVLIDRILNIFSMIVLLPLSLFNLSDFKSVISGNQNIHFAGIALFTRLFEIAKNSYLSVKSVFVEYSSQPSIILQCFGVSFASIFSVYLAVWILALHIGIDVNFLQVVTISVINYFVTLLPISVNGYGVREVLVTKLYVSLGATLEQASALAITTRFLMMLVSLPGSFWLPGILAETKQGEISPENLTST